jgi:DNA polymerase/3'-5' exonuclease PolX
MKHDEAKAIAQTWIGYLKDSCERIEIAGSIRRGKPEVKDVELVCIPKIVTEPDLFGGEGSKTNILEVTIGKLFWDRVYLAANKNGPRYKQLALTEGIHLDLFIVLPPAEWGVQFLIRTGPSDFSHWCVTPRHAGGGLPSYLRVKDGAVWNRTTKIETAEERDFFRLIGLEYIEPAERRAQWRVPA